MTDVSIEVCVVGYGNADTVVDCIRSIGQVPGATVALCDNHPLQDTVVPALSAARAIELSIRTESRPDNPGFAVACNQLAATSTADWLFFLNPDAVVSRWDLGWQPAGRGVVAPVITNASGRVQQIYGRARTVWNELFLRMQLPPRDPKGRGYVSGAALLVPRELFAAVGGFDEGYFMYYEDIDLCARVVAAGGTVARSDRFEVSHLGGHSSRRVPAQTALRSYASARRFHTIWGHSARAFDLLVVVDSIARVALLRAGVRVPGAEGAVAVLPKAIANLRRRADLSD